jgi:aspartyl/glutamyl-tRNA(Asn/Gln) amidotransferase C subunit
MSSIDREQIDHIAKLARIKLTEKEEEKFAKDLSSILGYVEKLNEVDTKDVKPIQQITELDNITRSDIATNKKQETSNKILNEAPDKKDNYFKVPKILE